MARRLNNTAKKTVNILKAFTENNGRWGITEIANNFNYPKSTVHGIVSTMVDEGFLERDLERNVYRVGHELILLGFATVNSFEIRNVYRPVIEKLSQRTHEAVFLCVILEKKIIVIDMIESLKPLKLSFNIGTEFSNIKGASAKIYQTSLSEDEQAELIREKKIDEATLKRNIAYVKEHGYATSIREHYDSISAAAAPVFHVNGKLKALIVIGGLSSSLDYSRLQEYGEMITALQYQVQ